MIVFMLGTPGCGKSEVYRRLVKKLKADGMFNEFPRIDDFPKLWDVFMKDEESDKWERSRPTDDGGYKVTDPTVWNDILKEVNKDVENMMDESGEKTLIFVEFSRPNYVESINGNFSEKVLKNSLVIYLDVPFEICWERNVRRHEQALESGTDDHLVSRDEMEETYGSDDKDDLKNGLDTEVVFISPDERDPEATKKLEESVEKAYRAIKEYAG